jgi:CheY-like chemotaxis protein
MIYLIDDKKKRQETDFGWDEGKFKSLNDLIIPIYTLEEVTNQTDEIFKPGNFVIYHESFLDSTELSDDAIDKREKLEAFAGNNEDFNLAIFSGSISSRSKNENVAFVPVAQMYRNLDFLVCADEPLLEILLFGENPQIERELNEKLEQENSKAESEATIVIDNSNVCFVRPQKNNIPDPIEGAKEIPIFNKVSDSDFSGWVNKWLNETKYSHIFIPVSLGQVLSDYNGLRLAAHIRCTQSINQTTRIIIYSFAPVSSLLASPYFDILKTKNVTLIPHRKSSMLTEAVKLVEELKEDELSSEMGKLKLDLPLNYEDSHSVANEWAIYRWARCLNIDFEDEFEKIDRVVNHNIYFKYLKTLFPVKESDQLDVEKLEIKNTNEPKVLFVDDELERGWNELLVQIIYDNGISFDSIGSDFKSLSKDAIFENVLAKVENQGIDIVILDFRLIESDFSATNINDVSSIQLIHKIKKLNPGIQILVFSATNKVWNYQAIMEAGADGFLIKEAPVNSVDSTFTVNSIKQLVQQLNIAVKRIFLKKLFALLNQIESNLESIDYEEGTEFSFFVLGLKKQLKIIFEGLKLIELKRKSTLDIVFLSCYNFLEQFKNDYYLNYVDNQYVLGIEEEEMNEYYPSRDGIVSKGKFIPENRNHKPSWFNTISALFIDYFCICGMTDDKVLKLNRIKDKRNNYIHNNKNHFDQNEIIMIVEVIENITSKMKE